MELRKKVASNLTKPFTFLGIRFAPVHVPFERRMQTFVIVSHMIIMLLVPTILTTILSILCFTPLFPISLAYVLYVMLDYSPCKGSRHTKWARNLKFYEYYRDYFPASLIKTVDLSPDKNYLIGYHPHGLVSSGAFCSFATEATGFSKKFPGIKPHLMTLKSQFYWPVLREINLSLGVCDVSERSINYVLDKNKRGNAAIIVIGGAEEVLLAQPGRLDLNLKNRKGFVRMAIKLGAQLVPCYSFGENEIYNQLDNPQGTRLRRFQEWIKRLTRLTFPLFYGRGIFNHNMGLLPYRHPIATVIGKPLEIQQDPNPTQEMIDKVHQEYLETLSNLFESHKLNYGISEDKHIEYV